MDISRLRAATATDHASVEGSMPLMDSHLDMQTYIEVMRKLHPLVAAWETLLGREASDQTASLAMPRTRLPLIEADLHTLHAEEAASTCTLPSFGSQTQLLGAMYVMEGSRLGGQLIARHVESTLGLERGQGTRYFRGFDERTGAMWKEFVEFVQLCVPDEEAEEMISGAKKMFTAFGSWMRQEPAHL